MEDSNKESNPTGYNPESTYEKKIITSGKFNSRSRSVQACVNFWTEVQEAMDEGWRFFDNGLMVDVPRPGPMLKVVLFKEISEGSQEPVEPVKPQGDTTPQITPKEHTKSPEDALDGLTKKVDLLAYAKEKDLEVPEDLKQASAIKKYIKEALDK